MARTVEPNRRELSESQSRLILQSLTAGYLLSVGYTVESEENPFRTLYLRRSRWNGNGLDTEEIPLLEVNIPPLECKKGQFHRAINRFWKVYNEARLVVEVASEVKTSLLREPVAA